MRPLRIVLALAIGAALPTIGSLAYFVATGDPTVRPLGISKEALDRFVGPDHPSGILVTVDWGQANRLRQSRDQVQALIARGLDGFGAEYRFTFREVPGDSVIVTYSVAGIDIGSFPARHAARGMSAAAAALRRAAPAVPEQAL